MSTKFTSQSDQSSALEPLTVLLQAASQSILHGLIGRLKACGYTDITEPHLILFGNLDCGATHAAQIAQRMQVSRQAISKTLRELQSLGLVRLEDDPARRNQKLVIMTGRGMKLAIDARRSLEEIENLLAEQIGDETMAKLRSALETGWGKSAESIQFNAAILIRPT